MFNLGENLDMNTYLMGDNFTKLAQTNIAHALVVRTPFLGSSHSGALQ